MNDFKNQKSLTQKKRPKKFLFLSSYTISTILFLLITSITRWDSVQDFRYFQYIQKSFLSIFFDISLHYQSPQSYKGICIFFVSKFLFMTDPWMSSSIHFYPNFQDIGIVDKYIRNNLHFLGQFREFVKEKADIERDYAKKIESLCKKYTKQGAKRASLAIAVAEKDRSDDIPERYLINLFPFLLKKEENIILLYILVWQISILMY